MDIYLNGGDNAIDKYNKYTLPALGDNAIEQHWLMAPLTIYFLLRAIRLESK